MLKINSASRSSGVFQNCKITLNQPLSGNYRVRSCFLPNSFYNISGVNILNYTGGTVVVPVGFYTPSLLASALQAGMPGYTVTYSDTTGQITFNNATPFSLLKSPMFEILGLSTDSPLSTSFVTGIVNLATIRSYNFIINQQVGGLTDVATGNSWTFSIPCTVVSGDIQTVDFLLEAAPSFHLPRTSQLSIRVVDDRNVEIPLNLDWFIVVESC